MAGDMFAIMQTAQSGFAAQALELGRALDRHVFGVITKSATGTGDIAATVQLGERYRLTFVRCHFTGNAGTASFHVSVDSGKGSGYDARLFTVTVAGTDNDVAPAGAGQALVSGTTGFALRRRRTASPVATTPGSYRGRPTVRPPGL